MTTAPWPPDLGLHVTYGEPGQDLGGTAFHHLHNLADLAAEVGTITASPPEDAIERLLFGPGVPDAIITALPQLVSEAVQEGIRLGVHLALTVDASRHGWEAWVTAAAALRAQSGCSPELHCDADAGAAADGR